jgi:transposase
MARLALIRAQIAQIEATRETRLDQAPATRPHALVLLLARIVGVSVETADLLVHEVLTRDLRDRRAVARYAGLTGAPDESGQRRRERGLARAGNARVRRTMIELAWRFRRFQPNSALAQWYRARRRRRRRSPHSAQAADRRARPQAAHRALALRHHRRAARRRRPAASRVTARHPQRQSTAATPGR